MIRPSGRAVLLAAAAAPIALGIVLLAPDSWLLGLFYLAALVAACAADLGLMPPWSAFALEAVPPAQLHIGRSGILRLRLTGPWQTGARAVDIAIDSGGALHPIGWSKVLCPAGPTEVEVPLHAWRRGTGSITHVWLRWRGPFGLMSRTRRSPQAQSVAVIPDIQSVQDAALHLTSYDAPFGLKPQHQQGEGSEFEALRDYVPGLDPRSIDWKHSARHRSLVCKEFRTERNHQIILAFDSGQLMSQPVDGIPRLDHAINAGLMLAYTSLRAGDRLGIVGFDAEVRLSMDPVSGANAFAHVQRVCADLDYCHEETNFTLGLASLLGTLNRRSLVVLITEFVDTVTAELMLENVARLTSRHLVVFVSLQDPELRRLADAEPVNFEATAQSVVAHGMLQERRVVQERLRRLGVHCLDVPARRLSAALVNEYVAVKQRDLI